MMGGETFASHETASVSHDAASAFRLELTGAILAGGHSSRFGSNKALFAPDGETLIGKAADLLRPLVRELLVSASHANAAAYAFLELDIVEDHMLSRKEIALDRGRFPGLSPGNVVTEAFLLFLC